MKGFNVAILLILVYGSTSVAFPLTQLALCIGIALESPNSDSVGAFI
jgi:hypothetical protein